MNSLLIALFSYLVTEIFKTNACMYSFQVVFYAFAITGIMLFKGAVVPMGNVR